MLESLEKLRELRGAVDAHDVDNPLWVCHKATIIADEIEREISERYMPLPRDADGVPIHVGDYVKSKWKYTRPVKVVRIELSETGFLIWLEDNTARYPDKFHHVKPRTVEEVLEDLISKVNYTAPTHVVDEAITHYAAELQMRGERR